MTKFALQVGSWGFITLIVRVGCTSRCIQSVTPI
jgi:hypothetical protein